MYEHIPRTKQQKHVTILTKIYIFESTKIHTRHCHPLFLKYHFLIFHFCGDNVHHFSQTKLLIIIQQHFTKYLNEW